MSSSPIGKAFSFMNPVSTATWAGINKAAPVLLGTSDAEGSPAPDAPEGPSDAEIAGKEQAAILKLNKRGGRASTMLGGAGGYTLGTSTSASRQLLGV